MGGFGRGVELLRHGGPGCALGGQLGRAVGCVVGEEIVVGRGEGGEVGEVGEFGYVCGDGAHGRGIGHDSRCWIRQGIAVDQRPKQADGEEEKRRQHLFERGMSI